MARRVLSACALVAALTMASPAGADVSYRRGETVVIEGTVTDLAGAPFADTAIVLLAAHRVRRVEEGLARVSTRTDEQGRFAIQWAWHPYYDTFRIRVEAPTVTPPGAGGGLPAGVLTEVDLTRRIDQGSPVVVLIEIADRGPLGPGAGLAPESDDQRRVYEDMGKPDRVDRLEMPGGEEVAWWYFERGRSYHFRDGRLDQVMDFEPVKGF